MQRYLAVSAEGVRRVPAGSSFTLRVSGTSMTPVLREGDVVVARRLDAARRPKLGDLLVLDLPGAGLVVHRLMWAGAAAVRTRGDGSGRMDPPVALPDVLGRVERVEREGTDVTPTTAALRIAWLRGFAAAAWHRVGRQLASGVQPA